MNGSQARPPAREGVAGAIARLKRVARRAVARGSGGRVRFEFPQDFGLLIPVLISLLSLRLFRLASRTRQLPEALVGGYFLLVPFGISLAIRVDRFSPELAPWARAGANALFTLGGVALLLFAWLVFRRDARWARMLAWGGSLGVLALWVAGFPLGAYQTGANFFLLLPVYASYLWVFLESLRYWTLLRRRLRLGLADPVVTNRFLLFAIWTGGVVAITLLGLVGALVQLQNGSFRDGGGLGDPVLLGITRLLALPIAVAIWLTFLPPRRYHAWLCRGAASAG